MSPPARKAKPTGKKTPRRSAKPKVARAKSAPKAQAKPKKAAPKESKAPQAKETPKKVEKKARQVVLGAPPHAVVEARHLGSLRRRAARGFSFGELASAGVPTDAAKRKGLSLDKRRRSVVAGNVDSLKAWLRGTGESGAET